MKLRKIIAVVSATATVIGCMPQVTAAGHLLISDVMKTTGAASAINETKASPAEDFEYRVNDDGESVTVYDYVGKGGAVVIPSEIDGKKVTVIGAAFWNCSTVVSVEIPDTVTKIDVYAFKNCTSLTSIKIPDSVTEIEYWAFSNCTSLISVVIPNKVTEIKSETFYNCTSLKSVKIPDSVTYIGYGAFDDCTSLTSVEIPDSVTVIGESAFENCKSLTSVKISNNATYIGRSAFDCCTSLTLVKIPDSVAAIETFAFRGCRSLISAEISNSMTVIKSRAFESSPFLTIYGIKKSYAQSYAEEEDVPFKVIGKEALLDYENGVIVEGSNLSGNTIVVSKSDKSTDEDIIYNIALKDAKGNEVQPEGEITVKLPVPEDWVIDDLWNIDNWITNDAMAYRMGANGGYINMKAEALGPRYITFTTDRLGDFVVTLTPKYQMGDLNSDGKITTVDAKWVLQAVSGSRELTEEQKAAADVNGDGKITTVDAKWILQAVSGSRVIG